MTDGIAISGWERVALAVEQVRDRLRRAVAALDGANVLYAVIGGNAVAEWVGRVDQAAVRNTRDVDILLRRTDFEAAKTALDSSPNCVQPFCPGMAGTGTAETLSPSAATISFDEPT